MNRFASSVTPNAIKSRAKAADGHNRDALLCANFGFAAGNQFRHGPAREFGFRPHFFGDAEFSQEGRGIGAAGPSL